MKLINNSKITIRSITLTAMLLAILVVQEEVLVIIPNVQLTTLLIMVYAAILPMSLLVILVSGYVLLDSLLMASLNPIYMIPMLVSWLLLAIFSKKLKNKQLWVYVVFGFLFGFLYGWSFIPSKMLTLDVFYVWPYLISDLPFEVIMAVTNAIFILLLYKPLVALLQSLLDRDKSV
ncbi:MAG: hypothetical protein PHC62_04460 [Candidatus Izemoplasmatales bacterium]|jgi:hypothetical protein|nr:hypothetical protein [Candidatus Izemoplasmatales bacterium]